MAQSELARAAAALRRKIKAYDKAKRRLLYGEIPVRRAKKRNQQSSEGSAESVSERGYEGGETGAVARPTNTKEDGSIRGSTATADNGVS